MSGYEVPNPILNSPFDEPAEHWNIVEGEEPERLPGRRPAMYFYRDPLSKPDTFGREAGTAIELKLVNRIRQQVKAWRDQDYAGASRTTLDLLQWWRRDGRRWPLFFAQLEAAETTVFLTESRPDFRQGLNIPCEELGPDKLAQGCRTFLRYACKMATGTGKTTVMGMIAAWSILKKVFVESVRYVESDTAQINRVLGREEPDEDQGELFGDDEVADEFFKEATVWIDGLDRIHKLRGINFCLDLSATPYYLGRVGQDTNRPFPWVVSDFGLIDAIESGLTKIPQLAVRDSTGAAIPGYFNIWHWILPQLTPAERGGKRANPKPEAILKYANHPIAMLGGLWQKDLEERQRSQEDRRPPVFILVCKNTAIAKVIYEWLAENRPPTGIPPAKIEGFRNSDGFNYTIRVDSKVVQETDDLEGSKGDEIRWMRLTLDTVGKTEWPKDPLGRDVYPEGFEELAKKLQRPLSPPGRDVRCIVSVGMLAEGWDCNTVTHIIGQRHDYTPDFIVRLKTDPQSHLILETKGWDPLEAVKRAAADRWVTAVNADGTYGRWEYSVAKKPEDVRGLIAEAAR